MGIREHIKKHKVMVSVTLIYIFIITFIMPLYAPEGVWNLSLHKYALFAPVTLVYITVFCIYTIRVFVKNGLVSTIKGFVRSLSATDVFLILYIFICIISDIFSVDHDFAIWGVPDWKMGLVTQTAFLFMFFIISRSLDRYARLPVFILIGHCLIFGLGIAMRYGIDPFGTYIDASIAKRHEFLSTLGQISWTSTSVAIILGLAMGGYCLSKQRIYRGFSAAAAILGFMYAVVLDVDSIFLAIAMLFFVLLMVSFDKNELFERFIELLFICAVSFRLMGLVQLFNHEWLIDEGSLSLAFSGGMPANLLFVIALILFLVYKLVIKRSSFDISRYKVLRPVLGVLAVLAPIAVVVYIYLNTTGKLPPALSSDAGLLVFDEYWGNKRGLTWSCAVRTHLMTPPFLRLFGAGNDCFYHLVYFIYQKEMDAMFAPFAIHNAHNEWLNALICTGILGAVAYAGIYISLFVRALRRFIKGGSKSPVLLAVILAVAAYMTNNLFCYQQIIGTSLVIVVMAVGESVMRGESGI